MIPIVANTDLEAFVIALKTCAGIEFEKAKIVLLWNTSSLSEILMSSSLVEQVRKRNNCKNCKIHMDGELLSFDEDGNMHPLGQDSSSPLNFLIYGNRHVHINNEN